MSAWEYNYPQDPDLTGTKIEFSLFVPPQLPGMPGLTPPIWDFSIELVDVNGWVRGWFVDVMTAGVVANAWNTFVLDPSQAMPQGFFPGPLQNGMFDLSKVTTIRLDEAGMSSATLVTSPPGFSYTGQWNAWNHLKVVPEPGSLLLLNIGLAGAGFARRRAAA